MFGLRKKTECQKISEKLSEYIDGRLEGKSLEHLEAHIDECKTCDGELAELRATVDLLKQTEQVDVPRSFAIDPVKVGLPERTSEYGTRALRWLRPALAVSAILFVVMMFVDFIPLLGSRSAEEGFDSLSSGGFDWRVILRIAEWGCGAVVLAFAIAFIYVSWRRHRGYPDRDDFNDLLR